MNNEPVAWIGKDELQFGFTDTRVTNEKESWDDIPLYTHPVDEKQSKFDGNNKVKELTDEEIDLVREVLNGCVSSIKAEIDQELQTFKGYEHCSNLPSLESELKDAEKAIEILRKAQER